MYNSTTTEEGEQESLLPRRRQRNDDDDDEKCCSGPKAGILINRILMLLVLVTFVAASVYFQSSLTSLHDELVQEEETVQKLVQTVSDHAEVIRRFNESVTQADVLKQLQSLEATVNETTHGLQHDMLRLQKNVNEQLHDTIADLGDTVKEAKEEIKNEVEKVKDDVDHYVITTQDQFSMENSFMVYQLAGTLTLLSCLISMWHMTGHIRKQHEPVVQRKILAILWMSPIYAVTSWFSLVFPKAEGYLAIIKDGYEAYVIYTFLSFCIAVLGKGDRSKVVDILSKRADHLSPPIRFCRCWDKRDPYQGNPRALADAVLLQCQIFAMQFVFLRPMTTIATVVLAKLEYYGAGDNAHDYRSPQFYISIIQNVSVFTAFTGLLKFYHAVDKDLEWCRPFAKFLCIKGVVFMTFWQGLAITLLAETTDAAGGGDPDEWGKAAQNFMICLEMLLFSIAHFYCFPVEEWEPGYRARASRSLAESLALGDFVQDLKLILKSSVKKKKKSKKKPSEPTVPEGDEEEQDNDDDETTITDISDLESTAITDISDLESTLRERIGARVGGDDNDSSIQEARMSLLAALSFSELESPKGSNDSVEDFRDDDNATNAAGGVKTANKDQEVKDRSHDHISTERTSLLDHDNVGEVMKEEHLRQESNVVSNEEDEEDTNDAGGRMANKDQEVKDGHDQAPTVQTSLHEHSDVGEVVTEECQVQGSNESSNEEEKDDGDANDAGEAKMANKEQQVTDGSHDRASTEQTSHLDHDNVGEVVTEEPPLQESNAVSNEEEDTEDELRTKNEEMLQPSIFTTIGKHPKTG
ncbi:Transmembrane protein 184C [Seminavis robusta]|uniref:Transmembrane protein 184C n=1 Tax=Seminavis robusta TaxID=568900 RepID=A0A9N8HVN8_9STRA|nr:Transmembrane protein 184C [Seminavis robusta]|eukprot:Sro1979_g309070.1 Transmembrane protein 184C (810) ;mRNA; f:5239-7942